MSTQRTAVVTGAARGIGKAVAIRFAQDGHKVAVVDLDEAACQGTVDEITAAGGQAIAVGADVSNEEQVAAAFERIAAELGAPTLLVNNAGIIRDNMLFKMTVDDWDSVMGVHLRGAFLMTKACQAFMTQEKYGRIVNLSSTSALGNRGQANYSAAKAGDLGFTKALAQEGAKAGITVNAICPGYIGTDMVMAVPEKVRESIIAQIPVGRLGEVDEIARAVLFLASDEGGFITGSTLAINGGQYMV